MAGGKVGVCAPSQGDVFARLDGANRSGRLIIIGAVIVAVAADIVTGFTFNVPNGPVVIEAAFLSFRSQLVHLRPLVKESTGLTIRSARHRVLGLVNAFPSGQRRKG